MTEPNRTDRPPVQAGLADACRRMAIGMLVLFGSRAPGGLPPSEDSDLDIAVRFHGSPPLSAWDLHTGLDPVFPGDNLDIALLSDADPLFRWEIMRNGVLLYGDPDEFAEYRAYAFREFVDSADLRALEQSLFEKKLKFIGEQIGAAS